MRSSMLRNISAVSLISFLVSTGIVAAPGDESSKASQESMMLTKGVTSGVEQRLLRLIEASQEQNPPDERFNHAHLFPGEEGMSDEVTGSDLEESFVLPSEMPDKTNNHINESMNRSANPIKFEMSRVPLKANLLKVVSMVPVNNLIFTNGGEEADKNLQTIPEDSKRESQKDPYNPANEGTSKGGGHKGQRLHLKTASFQTIPVIKMGEDYEENRHLRVIRPWNS